MSVYRLYLFLILESCLLKDLGIAEHDIKENSYSKLGVISRTNEFGFTRDALGSLMEEKDDERHSKDHQFPIPTIVESLASIRVREFQKMRYDIILISLFTSR